LVRRLVAMVRRVVRTLVEPVGRRETKMKGKGRREPLRRKPSRRKGRGNPSMRKTITRRRRKTRETRGNRTYGLYSTLTHLNVMNLPNKNKSKNPVVAIPLSPPSTQTSLPPSPHTTQTPPSG